MFYKRHKAKCLLSVNGTNKAPKGSVSMDDLERVDWILLKCDLIIKEDSP